MQGNLQPGKKSDTVLEGNRWEDQTFNVHTAMKEEQICQEEQIQN